MSKPPVKVETVGRIVFGVLAACVVLLVAAVAIAQPDDGEPLDPSVFAVAVIVDSMEEHRAEAVALPAGYLRIGCTWEALDPTLRDAYAILVADPLFSLWAQEWRDEYWDGLVACSKGDLPKATVHFTPAFNAADKMVDIAGRAR